MQRRGGQFDSFPSGDAVKLKNLPSWVVGKTTSKGLIFYVVCFQFVALLFMSVVYHFSYDYHGEARRFREVRFEIELSTSTH